MRIGILLENLKKTPFTTWLNLATTLATVLTLVIGWRALGQIQIASEQLTESRKTDQGNFILSLNKDFFFNDRLTQIRTSLETDQKILIENGGKYDDVQVDDYIGFFDTLSGLIDRKILDYQLVDENFGYYIKQSYDNSEIKTYIKNVKKDSGSGVYIGFEKLGKKISEEGY